MDKQSIFIFGLMLLILIGIQFNSKRLQQEHAIKDSVEQVNQAPDAEVVTQQASNNNTQNNVSSPLDTLIKSNGTGQTVTLENDKLKVSFNSKGGVIEQVELKDYKKYGGEPLILSNQNTTHYNYQIPVRVGGSTQVLNTENFVFDIKNKSAEKVSFELNVNNEGSIVQEYSLSDLEYEINYNLKLNNLDDNIASGAPIELNWKQNIIQQEKSLTNERSKTTIYYKEKGDDGSYLSETSDDDEKLKFDVEWLGFKQQFFNQTLVVENSAFKGADIKTQTPETEDSLNIKTLSAKTFIAYANNPNFEFPMHWYLGPNKYSILKNKGLDLDNMVYLGWAIFGWVNKWVIIPIFNFLNGFISNYGIIILILTLIIKMVLMPLTFKSYESMAKMQVLKPEIDEIKERYKDDPMKQQQATMKLYSSAGASPFSGCLPQLLQMPILFAMFVFFPNAIELRQQSFLWAEDLSTYDTFLSIPFLNMWPFYGHLSLFALLCGLSMILISRQSMSMNANADNPAMKFMPYIMPVFLMVFLNNYSAALSYYYLLSNFITFGQQAAIKKFFIDEDKIKAQIASNKKKSASKQRNSNNTKSGKPKPQSGVGGWFQRKLEEAQKMQEQAMREQQKKQKGKKK